MCRVLMGPVPRGAGEWFRRTNGGGDDKRYRSVTGDD